MSGAGATWGVMGTFRQRPVPQGEIVDLLSAANLGTTSAENAPILLYDLKRPTAGAFGGSSSSSGGGGGADGEVTDAIRVPRFVAQRIDIPSTPTAPPEEQLRMISLAPPAPLTDGVGGGGDAKDVLNVDCPPPLPPQARGSHKAVSRLLLLTTIPSPSQLLYILPLLLCLGDIGVLIASLTTQRTSNGFIAACCVLILVPDLASFVLLVKKGSVCTTIAFHLLLWPNIVLMYVLPFASGLLFIHFILLTVVMLFTMRLRESSCSTVCYLGGRRARCCSCC